MVLIEKTIWILEDDSDCRFVYESSLALRYRIRFFEKLETFEAALAEQGCPDLVIADLRLPDGFFLGFLQKNTLSPALLHRFIIVSSVDDLDVIRGCYQKGALEYMTKPFTKNELTVKVERILNQGESMPDMRKVILDFEPSRLEIRTPMGDAVPLTAKEAKIFSVLWRFQGTFVTRDQVLQSAWGNITVGSKTLDVHVYNLRKKISVLSLDIRFDTVQGYKLSPLI